MNKAQEIRDIIETIADILGRNEAHPLRGELLTHLALLKVHTATVRNNEYADVIEEITRVTKTITELEDALLEDLEKDWIEKKIQKLQS